MNCERCDHIFQPAERAPFHFRRPLMVCQFCGASEDPLAFAPPLPPPPTQSEEP